MLSGEVSIRNFDYLRAIAALLVFVSHIFQVFWLPIAGVDSTMQSFVHIASESAVLVFFVLSGYVISMSLMNNIRRNKNVFVASEYIINRFSRIYPPLVMAVLISLISYQTIIYFNLPGTFDYILGALNDEYHVREHLHISFIEIITALSLYGGLLEINGPLWSLYIEVKMYVIAGLVIFLIYSRNKYFRVVALVLGVFFIYKLFPDFKSYYYPMWWVVGVFFYIGNSYIKKAVLFIASIIILYLLAGRENANVAILQLFVIYSIFHLALRYEIGNYNFLSKVASFSYSLYLFHFPIFLLAYSLFSLFYQNNQPSFAERVVVSVLASLIAFHLAKLVGRYAENVIFFRNIIKLIYSKTVGIKI